MNRILIVTVTYGDRFDEISNGAYQTAISQGLDILIVCNGVTDKYYNKLSELKYDNVILKRVKQNSGSAGGFHAGLIEARNYQYDYYLLLDDDNFVVDSLTSIRLSYPAYFLYRSGRSYMDVALNGKDPSIFFAKNNSFLGFDILRILKKKFLKPNTIDLNSYNFPWCPYGGLLISENVLRSPILPNRQYFLYCDDTEYTSRISKKFGLRIIDSISINDYEESWNVSSKGNVITRILTTNERWRAFYSIRNQVAFDCSRRTSLLFWLNFLFFISAFVAFRAFTKAGWRTSIPLKLVYRAIVDGFKNNLGDKGFDFR